MKTENAFVKQVKTTFLHNNTISLACTCFGVSLQVSTFVSDWNSALASSFQSCSVFRGNLSRRRRRLGEIWFSKNNLPIMFVEIAYCSAIGTHMAEITRYLNVFGWVVAMWALALGVTKISHKLYYDLLTSTGGRDLIMFWEIHSHKNGVSTVFGPSYDSFILDNIT